MKITGTMPCRNEAAVIGLSARVALMWCDELIVLDHASTDETPKILQEIAAETGRLTVLTEHDPTWDEMAHRQRLLEAGRESGATHIAIIDADEVLTGNLLDKIRPEIFAVTEPGKLFTLPMYAMWRGLCQYRQDTSIWSNREITLAFCDTPALLWQSKNGYHFHHREPYASRRSVPWKIDGGVMHLQWANWRRLTAKHAHYKMTEAVRWPGRTAPARLDAEYSQALNERSIRLEQAPVAWWTPYVGLMQYYRPDEEPWQEAACAELWKKHGPEPFRGLNLYGLVGP